MKRVLFILFAAIFAACSTSKITQSSNNVPQNEFVFEEIKVNVVEHCDTTTNPFFQLAVQVPKNIPAGWKIDNFNIYFRLNQNESFTHKAFLYDNDFTVPLFFMATEIKFSVTYRNLSDMKATKEVVTQQQFYDKKERIYVSADYVFTTKCTVGNGFANSKKQMKLYLKTPMGMEVPDKN